MKKINWLTPLFVATILVTQPAYTQCTESNASASGTRSGDIVGQSFTTTCAGNISSATLEVTAIAGGDGAISNADVTIWTGDDGSEGGTQVGSTLAGQTLVVGANTFDLSASGIVVASATQYTISINTSGDADDITVYSDGTNPYAGGASWIDAGPDATRDLDFSVTVNDAPVISDPGAQTTDGVTNVDFSGGNAITITDGDSDDQSVTIDVVYNGEFRNATSTGTLTATASGGAALGGSGTSSMTISGNFADVNATLATVDYVPGSVAGVHQITVTTDDGNGGTDTQTIDVGVTGTYTLSVATDDAGDPEVGSLRGAIVDANSVIGADVIDASGLGATQTISLAGDLPVITDDLTINGPSVVSDLTIDGADTHSLFENLTDDDFTITDITLANGLANTAGGAIRHISSGLLTVERVHFFSNSSAGSNGGAISITNDANITQSLFEANSAGASGGAIVILGGTISITNSTFSGNAAGTSGGAIRISTGTVSLEHLTITGNTATSIGDGIESTASTSLDYSIVYGNGTEDVSVSGGTFDAGSNASIIGTSSGTITNNTNIVSSDPGLGSLADNGGETQTIAIGPNARNAAIGSTQTTDQIGTTRPGPSPGNDLGALEEANTEPTGTAFSVAAAVDGVGTIATSDLGYSDADGDALVSVFISTLPGGGVTLFHDLNDDGINDGGGETVSGGSSITLADLDLGRLKYEASSTAGSTTFNFTVYDGEDLALSASTATLYSVENALDFDGTNDIVSTADDAAIDFDFNQDFTVELWVNIPSGGQNETGGTQNDILTKFDEVGDTQYPYAIRYNNSTGAAQGQITVARYDGTNNPGILSTSTLDDDLWHHIAFVRNGTTLELYIDGVLEGTTTDNTSTTTTNADGLYLGGRAAVNKFTGQIDEVRIWNDARTDVEIRTSAADRIADPSVDASLVLYYDFNQGVPDGTNTTETTLLDRSLSGIDGSLADGSGDAGASGFLLSGAAGSNWTGSGAFASTAATTPNITVLESTTVYPSGGTAYDFGSQPTATNTDVAFTILNQGFADLNLNGAPTLGTGTNYSLQSPYTPTVTLTPGATQSLTVRFTPSAGGTLIDQVSIPSDDAGSPYLLNVTGDGQIIPTYTATWLDDGDGDIDQLRLDFNTAISVTDNTTSDAFDAFSISGFTIDNVNGFGATDDFNAISGTTSILFDISGVTGTASPAGATITYNTSSDEDITADVGGLELTAAQPPTAQVDGAAPVLLSVTTLDDGNGEIDVIELVFSEDIDQSDIDPTENSTGVTDDFTVSGGYTIAGVDTDTGSDSDVIEITLTESGSPDTGVTPDITIVGSTISDVSENNTIASLGATTATDGAPPVLYFSQTLDVGGSVGQLDLIELTFSETIDQSDIDPTENSTGVTDDFTVSGGYTILGVDTDTGVDSDVIEISLAESGSPDTGVTPDITITGGTISDANEVGFIGALGATTVSDGVAPIIIVASNVLQTSNAYLEVSFSEGLYDGSGTALDVTDNAFAIDFQPNTGTATNATIDDLTQTDNTTATAAGDAVIRFQLAVTGSSDGNETIEITPTDGASVYDGNNNPMSAGQTTTVINLNAVAKVTFVDAYMDASNTFLTIEFSDPMSRDGTNASNKEAQWKDDRGLFYQSYNDGGSGVLFDFPTSTDMLEVDGTDISGADNGAQTQLRVNTNSVTGTPTGTESFEVYNPNVSRLKSFPDEKTLDPGATITVFLNDEFADLFANATATATDDDGDGTIDQVEVVMTDDIIDTTIDFNDFTFGGVNPTGFDTGITGDDDTFILLFTTYPDGTGVNSTLDYLSDGSGARLTDDVGNNIVDGNATVTDAAIPVIVDASIDESNGFVRVIFSEEINDNGDGDLTTADFDITLNDGGAGVSITGIFNNAVEPAELLAAALPEDTLIFDLDAADLSAVGSTENIEIAIKTSGNTIIDAAGNEPDIVTPETTGVLPFNDISFNVTILSLTPAPDNSYIEIVFSEPVARNNSETANLLLVDTDDDGTIRSSQWANGGNLSSGTNINNEDELFVTYNDNGSGLTPETNDDTDIYLASSTGTLLTRFTGYISDTYRFVLNPNDAAIPTFTGVETYTFQKRSTGGIIRGVTTDGFMSTTYSNTVNFRDLFEDTFGSGITAATAYDVDADGNIDQVEIILPDDVDDATVVSALGDFTFGGVNATSFVTSPSHPGTDDGTANDNIITLGFATYSGSGVSTTLDFTQGNLRDDGALPYADDLDGNLFLTGSVSVTDAAGPVVLSATTIDSDLNGRLDSLIVEFSEAFNNTGPVAIGDFSVSGYTVLSLDEVNSPTVTLSIDSAGGNNFDTYARPLVSVRGSIIQGQADGADNPDQGLDGSDGGTDPGTAFLATDGAAPYITVNSSSGNTTPDFSGTIDDPTANLIISVDGDTRSNAAIQNNGDGTWDYTSASDTHVDGPITVGSQGFVAYEVTVIGVDNFGNNRTDVTSNEYTLTGGAVVTAPTVGPICTSDGFVGLGQIVIDEGSNGDLSVGTGVTLRFTLPEGFEFNTAIPINLSNTTQGDISALSAAYIGTASFRVTLTVDNTVAEDILRIDDLEIKAVTGGVSGDLERSGGTAGLSTSATSFASMSSNTSPAALTFVTDQDANDLTDTTLFIVSYVDVVYSAPTAPPFIVGDTVSFDGGTSGIVVSDNGVSSMQVYLIDGGISGMTGAITAAVGTNTATTSSATFNREDIVAFTLDANVVGPDVAKWYNAEFYDVPPADSLVSSLSANSNTALGVTDVGLYSFDVGLNDGTCDSELLRFNAFVYNDLNTDYEHTFVNNIYIEDDDRDTIYLSNPANHTVSVTGAGITVTNPSSTDLLILFDPAIAGSTNSPHTITYQVTNDITGEVTIITRQMTVNPVTDFFTVGPGHTAPPDEAYCASDMPVTLRLDPTQYGSDVNNDLQFTRFFFREWMNADGIGANPTNGFYERRPSDLGGAYPWATDIILESGNFTSSWAALNDGDGTALFVQRLTLDPIEGRTIEDFEYYFIYGTPLVSISNVESNYCDVDAAFTIARDLQYVSGFTPDDPNASILRFNRNYTIETNEPITNGYILEVWNGSSYDPYEDFTSTGPFGIVNEFDPSDPDQDGDSDEDESGQYRITYTTEDLTPANCPGQTTIVLNVRSPEATPFLDATTLTNGSSTGFFNNASPDAGIDADEYVLEYCVGDVVTSFTAADESVYNYNDLYTGIVVFPAGPVFTLGETIIGQTSGAKAVITSVGPTTIEITSLNSDLIVGENFQGQSSAAIGSVSSFTEYTFSAPETIQGLTSLATATITAVGDNRFEFTPISGTFQLNEQIIGLTSGDRGQLTGLGEISWYNESQQRINAFENNYSINPGAVGLNIDASFALRADETQVFYFSTTSIYDCESELRKVTVNVFDIPSVPVLDITGWPSAVKVGDIYTLDYCVEDDGSSTTPAQLSLPDLLEDESYNISRRFWDASMGSSTTTPVTLTEPGTADTDPQSITVPDIFAGDSVIFLISRTENISLEAYNNFAGCTGDSITVKIVAQEEASVPTNLDFNANTTEFHICEGDALPNINHSFINGVDEYIWYEGVDGSNNGVTRIGDPLTIGDPMTESTLETASTIPASFVDIPNVYTVYVSRNNDIITSRGFDGCESEAIPVTITVHAIQNAPSIASDNGAASNFVDQDPNLTDDIYNFKICSDQLDPTFTFVAGDLYAGEEQVEWRLQGETNPRFIGEQPTFSNLGLVGLSTGQVIYEVIQVTDTLTDSFGNFFEGCESEVAQLIIDISDPENLEVVNDLGDPLSDFFCREDDPLGDMSGDLRIELEVDNVTANTSRISSYTIDSYTEAAYLANGAADGTISGSTSFPTVNLIALHDGVTGSQAVGGDPTVHVVSFTYADETTLCESIISKAFYIYPSPNSSLLVDGSNTNALEFCYDDPIIDILGYDVDNGVVINELTGTGSFSINTGAGLANVGNNAAEFNPSGAHDAFHGGASPTTPFASQSTHRISYSFEDDLGCQRDTSLIVIVNPRPQIVTGQIQAANSCATDNVQLFVDMADGASNYTFSWRVGGATIDNSTAELTDEDGNISDGFLTYNLQTNSANFGVTATHNTTGCQASINLQQITVGEAPDPSITWAGTTEGRQTTFRIEENNEGLPDGNVDSIGFKIGTSQIFSDESNPFTFPYDFNHTFANSGTFTLIVGMRTTAGCRVSDTTEITIIDHLPGVTSYIEDFESGDGGWTIETLSLDGKENSLTTSWEIGTNVPDSTSGTTYDGSNAIYTNGYQSSEVSFVYSPSFDLSAFTAPTISFLRYEQFETFRDGVVFQMSTDDGRTWTNVGGFDDSQPDGLKSTPNWYNREAITSAPGTVSPGPLSTGGNAQGVGWALDSDWKLAQAPLSIPVGEEQYVRFRFALAAQATPKTTNGFAFDLVSIYDREGIVLFEQFSSTLSQSSYDINSLIDSDPIFNGSDILRINYFTDFANSGTNKDVLNQRNSTAPGARSSYYGIKDVPSLAISGDPKLITDESQLSGSIAAQLENTKLINPGFDITINASIDAENVLTVGADFTAISEQTSDNTKLGLFLAILEPEIVVGTDIDPIGLYQNGDVITNVLRKMLPSAAGQFEQGAVAVDDVLSIDDRTWPISNMYVMDTLTIVAYVQNLTTKQVIQSAILGLSNPNTELALGLEEVTDFSLYPNPADREVTVEFADALRSKTEWVIFDQAGREVLKGELSKGARAMTVRTEEMPSGLYFIHLYGEDRKRQSKRMMVIH